MAEEIINYEAVLVDLQHRRDQIDAAIAAIRLLVGTSHAGVSGAQKAATPPVASQPVTAPPVAAPHPPPSISFLGMTIRDAARKFLEVTRSKQATSEIWQALVQGGLPLTKYNAVYTALTRREGNGLVRDRDGYWILTEWQPLHLAAKKHGTKSRKVKATRKPPQGHSGLTFFDGTDKILREANRPMHISEILPKLADMGKPTNAHSLSSTLRQDSKKRFENLGKNMWALREWPPHIKNLAHRENPLPYEV